MRAVFEELAWLGIRYFVTGSAAAAVHGVMRMSQDVDIVLDLDLEPRGFGRLADRLRADHAVADPIDFGPYAMASVIERSTADKVDLIMRRPGPFETSVFDRRQQHEVPGLGRVWVASVEDLVLAKLSSRPTTTSELQLRDCAQLLHVNSGSIDEAYLERWAARLGLEDRLREVSR